VTVAVTLLLAVTLVELSARRVKVMLGGCSVIVVDFVPPLSVVDSTTGVWADTGIDSTGAVVAVCPAASVSGCAGMAVVFVELMGIVIAVVGKVPLNVALAVAGLVPPTKLLGLTVNVLTVGGTTVRDACRLTSP